MIRCTTAESDRSSSRAICSRPSSSRSVTNATTRFGRPVPWCGQRVSDACLVRFPTGAEFESVSPAGFRCFTLSFDEVLLAEVAETVEVDTARVWGGPADARRTDVATLQLGRRLGEFFAGMEAESERLTPGWIHEQLHFEIPAAILAIWAGGATARPPSSPSRALAVRRAREYLEANLSEVPSIHDLCRVTGVSWRTLDYAFKERLGIGPKAFLQISRLNAVRHELDRGEPEEKVVDVANRWGFWHMGRFAADYRSTSVSCLRIPNSGG